MGCDRSAYKIQNICPGFNPREVYVDGVDITDYRSISCDIMSTSMTTKGFIYGIPNHRSYVEGELCGTFKCVFTWLEVGHMSSWQSPYNTPDSHPTSVDQKHEYGCVTSIWSECWRVAPVTFLHTTPSLISNNKKTVSALIFISSNKNHKVYHNSSDDPFI